MNRDTIESGNGVHGVIIKFLKTKKEPVSMKEIIDHVLEQRKLDGKTPGNTIRAILQRSKFIHKNEFAKFKLSE